MTVNTQLSDMTLSEVMDMSECARGPAPAPASSAPAPQGGPEEALRMNQREVFRIEGFLSLSERYVGCTLSSFTETGYAAGVWDCVNRNMDKVINTTGIKTIMIIKFYNLTQ